MNSPEKLSSAGTTPNKQVRGADRPSDHRGWPPEQPWLKVRTGVAKSPDTCGSHAGIYKAPNRPSGRCRLCAVQAFCCRANSLRPNISITEGWSDQRERSPKENATCFDNSHFLFDKKDAGPSNRSQAVCKRGACIRSLQRICFLPLQPLAFAIIQKTH